MSPDEEHEGPPKRRRVARLLFAVPLLVLGVVLVAVGVRLWEKYDPFVMDRPDVRQAKGVLEAARSRPLSDEEFDRAVGLLGSDTPAAQLSAITTLQLEATRTPARRGRVVAALEGCPGPLRVPRPAA